MSSVDWTAAAVTAVMVVALAIPTVEGGSNGMAKTPPMSWRSWNQYGWYINETIIKAAADGLVSTSRRIHGRPQGTTLRDIGYGGVGMDEGWAACPPMPGPFPHGRDPRVDPRAAMKRQQVTAPFPIGNNQTSMYHQANHNGAISPVVDNVVFPDMGALVNYIHGRGLRAGWYLNDCLSYCAKLGDSCSPEQCIPGDVKAWATYGFDDLKIDGCSAQRNPELWASLINQTGKQAIIENCNNGANPSEPIASGGCPYYHQYRTSGDIYNAYASWVRNAQTVAPYATSGRSGPGCWAYPDMLMIGVQGETPDELHQGVGPWYNFTQPSFEEQRTHFGLWCTLSAPLTLSLDFTNDTAVESVWSVITNVDAIEVDQSWAGSPGTVFAEANSSITLGSGRKAVTIPIWQAWYKPLSDGTAAVFIANHGPSTMSITIDLSSVPSFRPPPQCRSEDFPDQLGDVRCFGLAHAPLVNGSVPGTTEHCCAACIEMGVSCETWNFCPPGAGCDVDGVVGCYVGKMGNCINTTDGWISMARRGPTPSTTPPVPSLHKRYELYDIWAQQSMQPSDTKFVTSSVKSHDSVFLKVTPQ